MQKNKQKASSTFPFQRSLVCCAKKAGLLLFQFPDHLELWKVGESDGHGEKNTHAHIHIPGDASDCRGIVKMTFIRFHLRGLFIVQFHPTGKPGDSLSVKRKPEKLIHLKKKVCNDVMFGFTLDTHLLFIYFFAKTG